MREIVEAFVHYELVVSGNRLVVTSRPEGVDLDQYKTRFAVMNLSELSQEQQRTVIQMQLQGNAFFEHLVNIAECRKNIDVTYREAFRGDTLRSDIEEIHFGAAELLAFAESASQAALDCVEAKELRKAEREVEDESKMSSKEIFEENEHMLQMRWATLREKAAVAGKPCASPASRRLVLDSPGELQSLLARAQSDAKPGLSSLRSPYLHARSVAIAKPVQIHGSGARDLLDFIETEIRNLPLPCTRAHVGEVLSQLDSSVDEDTREGLVLLALQRTLPDVNRGRRRQQGHTVIPATGLWYQALTFTAAKYTAFDEVVSHLNFLLGAAAAGAGIKSLALQIHEVTGKFTPGSAPEIPKLTYRNPVELWVEGTSISGVESVETLPTWCACVTMRGDTGEQCLELLRRMRSGVELELNGELLMLSPLDIRNCFGLANAHPTRLRKASCSMLLTGEKLGSFAVMIEIEHTEIWRTFQASGCMQHYQFFWDRIVDMPQRAFDAR